MKPIDVLIVEDEPKSAALLWNMLQPYGATVRVVHTSPNMEDAQDFLAKQPVGLVFLDMEMPDGNGFELFAHTAPQTPRVIVTTAYEQYALPAIRHQVVDYLLKPLDEQELANALQKLLHPVEGHSTVQAQKVPGAIALPSFNGLYFIPMEQIMYCRSEGSYTRFYINNHPEVLVSRNIGEYEWLLPAPLFCRVHKEYIVNLTYVHEYIRGRGGYIILHNNTKIEVAARRKEELLSRFR